MIKVEVMKVVMVVIYQLLTIMLKKMVLKLKKIIHTKLEIKNVNMINLKLYSLHQAILKLELKMVTLLLKPLLNNQSQSVSKPIHQLSNSILQVLSHQKVAELN